VGERVQEREHIHLIVTIEAKVCQKKEDRKNCDRFFNAVGE